MVNIIAFNWHLTYKPYSDVAEREAVGASLAPFDILGLFAYDPLPALKGGFNLGGLDCYPAYNGVTEYLRSTGVYKPISVKPHVVRQPHPKGRGLPLIINMSLL